MERDNVTTSDETKGPSSSARQAIQPLQRRIAELEASEQQLNARIAELEARNSALQESQEHMTVLFKALPDLAFVLDENGQYVEVLTDEDSGLLYKPSSDMQGHTLSTVLPKRVAEPSMTCIHRALETGETQTLEYWLHVAGGRHWFEGRTAPIQDKGTDRKLVVWISRDITARKKAEQALRDSQRRYKLAATAGRVGIWEYNPATGVLYLDPHARVLLGQENNTSLEWESIVQSQDAEALIARAREHLSGHTPAFDYVCQAQHEDGHLLWILIRGSVAYQQEDESSVLVGTFTDVTDRREAEITREQLLMTLQRRNAQMQTAAEVASAISSMLDPEKLIQQVVDLIREGFDLYYVGLFLVDRMGVWTNEAGKWAILRAGTGAVGEKMVMEKHKLEIGGPSMIGWSIANQQARIALDVGKEAVRFENPWLPETRSELAFPLISRGETIGALTIQSEEHSAFKNSDITVLQAMADQLANAIINTRLYDQAQQEVVERRQVEKSLRRRQRELELLNSASRALTAPLDLDEVLNTVLNRVQQIFGVMACSVWLMDPEKKYLACRQATGVKNEMVIGWTLRLGQGIAGWVAKTGESTMINNTLEDDRYFSGVAEKINLDIRALLCVPLTTKEDIIGVLQVVDTEVDRFRLSELHLMESLAATAAIAIDNARLYEQARQDAATKTALLDEANHRVKNNLAAIMGILALELQKSYDKEDDYQALLRDLLGRIQGMATVHSLLSDAKWSPLSLRRLIEEIIHAALSSSPISHRIKVYLTAPSDPILVAPRQATNLAILINELTTNSIKHAFHNRKQGVISVDIEMQEKNGKQITLHYHDNGPGWPDSVLNGTSSGVGMRLMHLIAQGPMLKEFTMKNEKGAAALLEFKLVPFP